MNWDSRQLSIRTLSSYQESVEGSLIQATGAVEYEDGSWKGNQLRAQNNLQRDCTIPGVQPGAVRTSPFLRGSTEFQSPEVHLATLC